MKYLLPFLCLLTCLTGFAQSDTHSRPVTHVYGGLDYAWMRLSFTNAAGTPYNPNANVTHAAAPGVHAGVEVLGERKHWDLGLFAEVGFIGRATYKEHEVYASGEYDYTLQQEAIQASLGFHYAFYKTRGFRAYALLPVCVNRSFYPVNRVTINPYAGGGVSERDDAVSLRTTWVLVDAGLGVECWNRIRVEAMTTVGRFTGGDAGSLRQNMARIAYRF